MRLDKWLWAARFFKTRSIASEQIQLGRVRVDGISVKSSKEIRAGMAVSILQDATIRHVKILGLSAIRGSAPIARMLYEETQESLDLRAQAAENRKLMPEPSQSIHMGRITKQQRRQLDKTNWNSRWSASLDG